MKLNDNFDGMTLTLFRLTGTKAWLKYWWIFYRMNWPFDWIFSAWIGALSAAVSRGSAPLVVGACRRGSTRLTAVIGGFVLALASLFTSFALQMHQVLLRYDIIIISGEICLTRVSLKIPVRRDSLMKNKVISASVVIVVE